MSRANRIFVIGHSGAGKGVVAQAVAKQLGWKFINADVFGCATHVGRRLSEVISTDGELHLNQCLTEILAYQITQENIVVTTDESIIDSDKSRNLLKSEFTANLQVSVPVQMARFSECNYRPLLPVDNFAGLLDALHNEKDQLFDDVATISLSTDNGEIEKHARIIIEEFNS